MKKRVNELYIITFVLEMSRWPFWMIDWDVVDYSMCFETRKEAEDKVYRLERRWIKCLLDKKHYPDGVRISK